MSAAPAVSTHGGSQAFSRAKGGSPPLPPQWPETCPNPRCTLHDGIRVGSGRVVVAPSRPLGNAVHCAAWIAGRSIPLLRPGGLLCGQHMESMDEAAKLAMLSDGDTMWGSVERWGYWALFVGLFVPLWRLPCFHMAGPGTLMENCVSMSDCFIEKYHSSHSLIPSNT